MTATALASGASVVPRFGPVIETRYFAVRRLGGTVVANEPSLAVRFAVKRDWSAQSRPCGV